MQVSLDVLWIRKQGVCLTFGGEVGSWKGWFGWRQGQVDSYTMAQLTNEGDKTELKNCTIAKSFR